MAGRGRGRGRGIPINYPDGWACKPAPTPIWPTWDTLPKPLLITEADWELIELRRQMQNDPSTKVYKIASVREDRDFARYSDRYLDAPVENFSTSDALTLQCGVHFSPELLPPGSRKKVAGEKRKAPEAPSSSTAAASASSASASAADAGGAAAATASGAGPSRSGAAGPSGAGPSSSSSPPAPQRMRLVRGPSHATGGERFSDDEDPLVAAEDEGVDVEDGEKEGAREGGSDNEEMGEEDYYEEEEDELYDEGGGYDGYEDGGDDPDSGGDDEPTY